MLRTILCSSVAFILSTALIAQAAPKDDALAAAKKLDDAKNYSWKSSTEGGFGGGVQEGKAEKDGFSTLAMTVRDTKYEVVRKGEKGAIKIGEEWKTFEEAAQGGADGQPNPGRFLGAFLRNQKTPAALATDLVSKMKDVQKTDDGWSGDLTEEGVKELMAFRGRGGNQAPEIKNAKGNAKLSAKDGTISKIVYQVQGTVTFNNEDRDINRTTTIDITEVGTTKVEVAEEAKKKVS